MQARTGPAGYREIPGGPVGRYRPVGRSGGQQKYYDILFFLAIDVINYNENWIVCQGL